jgi:hypothetical protein
VVGAETRPKGCRYLLFLPGPDYEYMGDLPC